jgi:hypothetical protein
VGHALTSYGAASGMTFEEIRRLLSAHFHELLAQTKAKIANDGRLGPRDTAALQNGLAFAHDGLHPVWMTPA